MTAPQRYAEWVRRASAAGGGEATLFAGPESLLRDQGLARIKERVLGSGDAARLGHERYFGGESPLADVTSALSSAGLFSAARVVTLADPERAGRAPAAERRELLQLLRRGTGGSVFVALSSLTPYELERKNEFTRELLSVCRVVSLEHPRPTDALRWMVEEATRRGIRLQADAGRFLLARVGPDLQELSRELEKLEVGLPPGTPVGAEELREMVRRGELGTGWELCRTAVEGRSGDALRQWAAIGATEPVLRVQWLLQKTAREAAGAGAPQARGLLLKVYDLEFGVKSGAIPSRHDTVAWEMLLASGEPSGSRFERNSRPSR
jgi:DNA polymerase III delta subunit